MKTRNTITKLITRTIAVATLAATGLLGGPVGYNLSKQRLETGA